MQKRGLRFFISIGKKSVFFQRIEEIILIDGTFDCQRLSHQVQLNIRYAGKGEDAFAAFCVALGAVDLCVALLTF